MSLKFNCKYCGQPVIVKYLKVGELFECRNCGVRDAVPSDAMETDEEPNYNRKYVLQDSFEEGSVATPPSDDLVKQIWNNPLVIALRYLIGF